MEKKSLKVLFISHDATATGAPMVLIYLLKWLKVNSSIQFDILLRKEGKLLNEFQEIGEVLSWNPEGDQPSLFSRALNKARRVVTGDEGAYLSPHQKRLLTKIKRNGYDLLYANTGASGNLIKLLKESGLQAPVLCHVHELEHILKHFCDPGFKEAIPYINHFVVVSKATRASLGTHYNVVEDKTTLVYEFVPVKDLQEKASKAQPINLKKLLHLPSDAIIVAGAGTTDWRKGTDLFVQVAKKTSALSALPVYFIWLGGSKGSRGFDKYLYDIEKAKLQGKVFLLGHQDKPLDFFSSIDIFLLPSREDPFPLVCLEAAALQKPIICFESAGGIPEFVGEECGVIVPYLSVDEMAEKVIELVDNPQLAMALGRNAGKKVVQHDVSCGAGKIADLIYKIAVPSGNENKKLIPA